MSIVFIDATGTVSQPPAETTPRPVDDLGSLSPADVLVIYAPPPGWTGEASLITALQKSGARAVVVRAECADGFTPDPLAAACTGLIAGFGEAGMTGAVAFLAKR